MATLEEQGARAVGIAWMHEGDYDNLIRIFDDGDMFAGGWAAWNQRAIAMEEKMKGEGLVVVRAYIDPNTFTTWCAAHGVDTGREGRLAFANEHAHELYGHNQS